MARPEGLVRGLLAGSGLGPDGRAGESRGPSRSSWSAAAGAASTPNRDERVIARRHLMQAYGDIFLSRTRDPAADTVDRHFYVRQLRDWNSRCRSRRCSRRLRGCCHRLWWVCLQPSTTGYAPGIAPA